MAEKRSLPLSALVFCDRWISDSSEDELEGWSLEASDLPGHAVISGRWNDRLVAVYVSQNAIKYMIYLLPADDVSWMISESLRKKTSIYERRDGTIHSTFFSICIALHDMSVVEEKIYPVFQIEGSK